MAATPADWFADTLAPTAAPAVPVMPKPSGWQRFGDALAGLAGADIDRSGNYMKGMVAGSEYKLRSAQTESALAEAEKRRADAMRTSTVNSIIAKAQADPMYQPSMSDMLALATGAGDLGQGQLHQQEYGQRAGVADLTTPQPQRLANMEALTGRPVERFYQSGTGMQASQIDTTAAPTVTPVGEASIASAHALAGQRAASTELTTLKTAHPELFGAGAALAALPPEQQETIAQLIASGKMAVPTGRAAISPGGVSIISRAAEINPELDAAGFPTRQKVLADFNSGPTARRVDALNTAIDHLDTMDQLADALNNNDVQLINKIGNYIATQTGSPAPTNARAAAQLVGNEVIKAVINTGAGSMQERQEAASAFSDAKSGPQLHQAAATLRKLLAGQARSLEQRYSRSTGAADFGDAYLSDAARKAFGSLGHAAPAAASGAAGGWTKQTSPSTGAVRWINKATGETRNTAP